MGIIETAVFPVAGLGTRFLPATKAIPKEMLVVGYKPLIQHAVDEARQAGIKRFIFITSQGKAAIEDHFDTHPLLEATLLSRGKAQEVQMLRDLSLEPGQAIFIRQQQPLGLGHAVWCARHLIADKPFALLLADDLIIGDQPCIKEMVEAYGRHGKGNYAAVMDVPLSQVSRYGIISPLEDKDKMVRGKFVVEKPAPSETPSRTAIVGRYILEPELLNLIDLHKQGAGQEIQLTDAFNPAIEQGTPFYGVRFSGERYDCGTPEGWLEANVAYAYADEQLQPHLLRTIETLFPFSNLARAKGDGKCMSR